jgi:hypothetical protein
MTTPTTKRAAYEAAKAASHEAHRKLCQADGRGASEQELTRLSHEHERAMLERRRAFTAYMDSDEP